jgi:RNA polymerase sigma factor (sigma-70 family)
MVPAVPPGTRVAIVDDDPVFLRTLETFLRGAGLAVEAFRSAGDFLARGAGPRPECVVLDLDMPGLSGLELQEALGAREEGPPVVFVSGMADVPSSVKAMHRGAVDFLTKPFPREELLAAIGRAVERSARRRAEGEERQALAARLARLSPRERQVCALVVQGLLNKQIGAELGTSENTVKVHRSRAMHKLGASALPDLVRLLDRARELGIGGGKG